ncbi:MAG: hypothetical protein LRS46_01450 [Desulfurococcales archaeon]|nr:hypothetical protein [Desulfurococcales archaeon]
MADSSAARLGVFLIVGLVVGLAAGYLVGSHAGRAYQQAPIVTTTTTTTPMTTAKPAEAYNVRIAYSEKYGFYLTDGRGMTLYIFSADYDGKSHCTGQCAKNWPPFYVEQIKPAPGLDPRDFGVITRPDGTKQVTYKGHPLYYFHKDEKPGDIKGDGLHPPAGYWLVAKPDYTVLIATKPGLGTYLTDAKGMTLYFFAKDEPYNSSCYGVCAQRWPIFKGEQGRLVVPSVLNISDFSFIKRADGSIQLAYKGHPLYYFYKDKKPGDTLGQGVKGVWFVASITGILGGQGGGYNY